MRNSQGGDHPWPQILLIATALVFLSCNGGGSVSADDAYLYSSPPLPPTGYEHPYVYKSPSPYMSAHLHYHHTFMYSTPPPPVKSLPPPYNNTSAIDVTGSGVILASDDTPTYCVAKPDGLVDQNVLLDALNWVCSRVDCSVLLQGQRCYVPDTVAAHASYAFNEYYYQSGRLTGTCDFNGAAMVTSTDPSHDTCTFRRGRHQPSPTVSLGWSLPVSGTGAVLLVVTLVLLY